MPKRKSISKNVLTAGGGTINLDVLDSSELYILSTSGSVTLTSNYTIQSSGTVAEGLEYIFHYVADLDFNGNTLTIMGATIPDAIEDVNCYIRAYYNGSAWEVTLAPDFEATGWITGTMLANATVATANMVAQSVDRTILKDLDVTTGKIALLAVANAQLAASAVTVDKRGGTLNQEAVTIPLSFETGEQCDNTFTLPWDGTLTSIRYDVTKAIAATDAATITPLVNGGATTPSSISIALSTPLNSTVATAISAGGSFSAGDVIKLTTAKTTAGGKVIAKLTFTRI